MFEHTLSTQEHADFQVITKLIHSPVGMDQTEALIIDHLHLSGIHSE